MNAATALTVDFSRPPTAKQHATFTTRLSRLNGSFGESVGPAVEAMGRLGAPGKLALEGFRIRNDFTYLRRTPAGGASDRAAPKRITRPPATMIVSSQGATLRFYLSVLAQVQIDTRPGTQPGLTDLEIARRGRAETGWTDLVASGAKNSRSPAGVFITARDKKVRSVHKALDTLAKAKLVTLTGSPHKSDRYEAFGLLDEEGCQQAGSPMAYKVPGRGERYFTIPVGFVTNGWIHVLEDSEITVLLMVACGLGSLAQSDATDVQQGEIAIPGEVRLLRYGIHRDPFSAALRTLSCFGLLSIREMARHDDGRAVDTSNLLHRLSLNETAFDEDALIAVKSALQQQITRHR